MQEELIGSANKIAHLELELEKANKSKRQLDHQLQETITKLNVNEEDSLRMQRKLQVRLKHSTYTGSLFKIIIIMIIY